MSPRFMSRRDLEAFAVLHRRPSSPPPEPITFEHLERCFEIMDAMKAACRWELRSTLEDVERGR